MKSIFLLLLLSAIFFRTSAQNNDWENPALVDQGKERPHVPFMLFEQEKGVIQDDYSKSERYISLNGNWKLIMWINILTA